MTMQTDSINATQHVNAQSDVVTEVRGAVGCITLNRPKALNALTLEMVRSLTATLLAWRGDEQIKAVALRGSTKAGPFGALCAGGDIRFFHQAALAGNPELEDFFTEEYALNHLVHSYPKPYIAFMDGIVMGGGMGLCQGASHRLVTERTKMAMPETNIGLFPDVGGGYFLSACPGHAGEWLALTGETIGANEAIGLDLADHCVEPSQLSEAWDGLASLDWDHGGALEAWIATYSIAVDAISMRSRAQIDQFFALDTVSDIVQGLQADGSDWALRTASTLRKRSPLMLHVVLAQIRRARGKPLADVLRMERDMVRHCFHTAHLQRFGAASETVEGIRALAVDKDQQPRWNPSGIDEVTSAMVEPFFSSPWPAYAHPLRELR